MSLGGLDPGLFEPRPSYDHLKPNKTWILSKWSSVFSGSLVIVAHPSPDVIPWPLIRCLADVALHGR